jgi:hypothetical protein
MLRNGFCELSHRLIERVASSLECTAPARQRKEGNSGDNRPVLPGSGKSHWQRDGHSSYYQSDDGSHLDRRHVVGPPLVLGESTKDGCDDSKNAEPPVVNMAGTAGKKNQRI